MSDHSAVVVGRGLSNGNADEKNGQVSKFSQKIEASSAKVYFHYYGQLLHQQNMLQDYVRTGCSCHPSGIFLSA